MSTSTHPSRPDPEVLRQSLPTAIIVDIDGTLALHTTRPIFAWDRVLEDEPNWPVIMLVRNMHRAGYRVILTTGRLELCRADTELWLKRWLDVPYDKLLMRPDERQYDSDVLVKGDMFELEIWPKYRILFVVDDRTSVVQMWRSKGLTVLQCADGDF